MIKNFFFSFFLLSIINLIYYKLSLIIKINRVDNMSYGHIVYIYVLYYYYYYLSKKKKKI